MAERRISFRYSRDRLLALQGKITENLNLFSSWCISNTLPHVSIMTMFAITELIKGDVLAAKTAHISYLIPFCHLILACIVMLFRRQSHEKHV